MYQVTVSNKTFEITPSDDGFVVNNQLVSWDIVPLSGNYFHILFENKSFRAEVVKIDPATKAFTLKINNQTHVVQVKNKFDLLLEKMGMNNIPSGMVNVIKAPMPGLIIDLKVKAGDEVQAQDSLLILEAMKMENIIKSPGAGTVKSVKVKKGDNVEKNQVLIEF